VERNKTGAVSHSLTPPTQLDRWPLSKAMQGQPTKYYIKNRKERTVRYMQIKGSQKLHLVYEPGEGISNTKLIPAGKLSAPICGRGLDKNGKFRMTINVPLSNACRNCLRIYAARHG